MRRRTSLPRAERHVAVDVDVDSFGGFFWTCALANFPAAPV